MNRKLTCLVVALLSLATQSLRAANLALDGAPSYSVAKSKITIVAPKIINMSPTNNSGPVRLQVWAANTVFSGGEMDGYLLGTTRLSPIPAGGERLSVSNSVPYKAPPNGNYYPTITLEEYDHGQWVVRNYYNGPGPAPFSTDAVLSLDGAASWSVTGNTAKINVDKVSNYATAGRSGNLRLELWTTAAPYTGGPLIDDQNGYLIAASNLGRLAGGFSHNNVKRTARYLAPPDGYFFTTLVLSEWNGSEWVQRDNQPFTGASYFGGSSADAAKLDLQAPVSWTLVGKNVKMRAAKIVSSRVGGTSGPLTLQLWATTQPYGGGTFDGYVLASAKAGKVAGGGNLHNLTKVGKLSLPPDGEYFTTIVLIEETPTGDVVQDFIPLGSSITLDRKMIGGLSSTGVAGTGTTIEMSGRTTYAISKTNANLIVSKITNNRPDITGNLKLGLYALAEPYVDGPINGVKIAERQLGRLAVGASYTDISGLVPYTKPAAGTYYILLTLEEWQVDKYVVVDSVAFARPIAIR